MFHFPRCRPPALFDSGRGRRDRPAGLPHSETHGSRAACASPWNIAACRVLRRHPLPRHPSCARKAWPQNLFRAAAPPDLDAPAGSPRRAGAGSPFCILLPSKSISIFRFRLSKSALRASRGGHGKCLSGMVGAPGLEPGTSSLSEKRSNQLSYAPAGNIWWSRRDSNPRHPACKAGALPAELRPPRRAPAPRESSGAIRAEHRPRLRPERARRPL